MRRILKIKSENNFEKIVIDEDFVLGNFKTKSSLVRSFFQHND